MSWGPNDYQRHCDEAEASAREYGPDAQGCADCSVELTPADPAPSPGEDRRCAKCEHEAQELWAMELETAGC